MALPSGPEGKDRRDLDRLKSLSGSELDRAYLDSFGVPAHRKTIALFERESRNGQDQELKQFAAQTLPKLREHLRLAQETKPGSRSSRAEPSSRSY